MGDPGDQTPAVPEPAAPRAGPANRFDRFALRWSDWLLDGRTFALAIVGYWLLQALLRLALLPDLGDGESVLLDDSGSFELGYDADAPPLMTWIVIAAQSLVGVSPASVLLPKFALLALSFLLFHAAAREATADPRYAVAAALSPLLLHELGWQALRDAPHSALLAATCAAVLVLVLRLMHSRATIWYVLLGLMFGAGLLAHYGFAVCALALVLAGLLNPVLRRRFLSPRGALALAIAVACALPHWVWLLDRSGLVVGDAAQASWWEIRANGLGDMLCRLLQLLLPLALVLAVLFPRAFRGGQPVLVVGPAADRALRAQRLIGRFLAAQLALSVLLVLASGFDGLRTSDLLIFLPAPLWVFARASLVDRGPAGIHRFVMVVLAAAAVATAAHVVSAF